MWVLIPAVALSLLPIGWLIYSARHISRVERSGVPGQAVVLSVWDQGNRKGPPIVRFHCNVTPDDTGRSFEGDTKPFVARTTLASYYIGQTVQVRMNPRKRTEFYIVGDSHLFYADSKHP